jgi:hypothetical protein
MVMILIATGKPLDGGQPIGSLNFADEPKVLVTQVINLQSERVMLEFKESRKKLCRKH